MIPFVCLCIVLLLIIAVGTADVHNDMLNSARSISLPIDPEDHNPWLEDEDKGLKEEYILCAAIWYDNGKKYNHQPRNITSGIVVSGWRHNNCFAVMVALFPNKEYIGKTIQGFISSKGNFYDRAESKEMAINRQQVTNDKKDLYSEDLY